MNEGRGPSAGSASEERLRHRLDLARNAVAALAHEINQPLAAATTYLDVARRMLGKATANREEIAQILEKAGSQTQRASRLVGSLRELLQFDESDKTLAPLHEAIEEALDVVRGENALGDVEIMLELAALRDGVLADRLQLGSALCTLLRSAAAALRPTGRRKLAIRTSNPNAATIRVDMIDGDDRSKTTQPDGEALTLRKAKDMGSGLLTSLIIIEEHDGRIWAASNPAAGFLFSFTLPLQDLDVSR